MWRRTDKKQKRKEIEKEREREKMEDYIHFDCNKGGIIVIMEIRIG